MHIITSSKGIYCTIKAEIYNNKKWNLRNRKLRIWTQKQKLDTERTKNLSAKKRK